MEMVKRSPAVPAATSPAQLSTDELRALLTTATRCAIAEHIAIVLSRGPVERAFAGWIDMFSSALRSFCRVTSFSEDPLYRRDANSKLPRAAASLLFSELRHGGKLQPLELAMADDALNLVQRRRGKQWNPMAECPSRTFPAPSTTMSQRLGLYLNIEASRVIAEWEAYPPPPEQAVDLARLWLIFGDRSGIDREVEFTEWRARQRKAKRSVSVEEFCLECDTSTTQFYEGWIHGRWPDESPQAQRVLAALSRPVEYWPPDIPRRKRDT